ncbi:hypothetical protein PHYBOEH_001561 [Phytophthora boehmeriae]|uniref:FYVE-type domain-containing protein n=1 Tax=Phytophthora boehmeriae TaxID=109152 RepID=A0A8T1WSW6_9STRA|nr:hypothetical protein PHYBOEH_001561 [Phytophthora boehmeriae]
MRFPLPADTFPDLWLPMDDKDALKAMADVVIGEALGKYREFRAPPLHGEIDESRWKIIKKRDGITSYSDRTLSNNAAMARDEAARESIGSMSFSTKLHGVLAVGTIQGTLNDLMYGLHHCTTELMAIKTVYMEDKIVDTKVLAEIKAPTPEEPVNSLYLKWSVSEFAPVLLRKVVRPRDFVYMEAVGILKDENSGERIGYSLLHSLQIPDIRELTDYQIVRGNFSICGLFRQKSPGVIEVHMNGFVDSMGDIHTGVAIPATAEALMSYRQGVYCGQMKKLNWLLKTKKTIMVDRESGVCAVCSKSVKPSSSTHTCQVCMSHVCASCSVKQKLAFLQAHTRRVVRRNLNFCARCMRVAIQTDGLEVASEELRRQNPFEYFELSSNDSGTSASPSNSVLPDNQQEFFG